MELFRFVNRYAESEEDQNNLEKWWPYILRVNGTARAMLAVQEGRDFEKALGIVQSTREKIENLEPLKAEEFSTESERSRKALDDLEKALKSQKPLNEVEKLQNKIEQAVAEERFEEAAVLRDKLKELENQNST